MATRLSSTGTDVVHLFRFKHLLIHPGRSWSILASHLLKIRQHERGGGGKRTQNSVLPKKIITIARHPRHLARASAVGPNAAIGFKMGNNGASHATERQILKMMIKNDDDNNNSE